MLKPNVSKQTVVHPYDREVSKIITLLLFVHDMYVNRMSRFPEKMNKRKLSQIKD
jgi:hypothetical protein